MTKEHLLYKMTWPEIKDAIPDIDAVLVPVGSTEQHGRHLPVEFDHFSATQLCEMAAKRLNEKGRWIVLAPTVSYGCSWYHINFAGTISLSHRTFMDVVKEICTSLAHHGFKNLILFNSHGGNTSALTTSLNELFAERRLRVILAQWFTFANDVIRELGIKTPRLHAGEAETSLALALNSKVRADELTVACMNRREVHEGKGIPVSRHIAYDPNSPGSGVLIPMDYIDDISDSGVVGDATLATTEKGRRIVDGVVKKLCELIEDLSTNCLNQSADD